ncbi:Nitrogen fixation protein NifW [Rivularia sp. PCC 7116]|uniref:nitrogenase-stabilizing/protective protein NifW n=1 Tax=Rivularia sp. PCC 7116 TaxID=373994 RepID=UPI00029F131B|nr:nitrogenase-stabilizing/protective protein NifW [Rivularia sp. PCC 7116]AFY58562.1 Nitrogen fixation protein NifW [Rivularia sp. PCC 7116]
MSKSLEDFKKLVNTEDYFQFFDLEYDQKVVHVNRLHILQKFSEFINEIDKNNSELNEEERLGKYREALESAYQVFIESTPQQEKLFKVFHQKPKNVVKLTEIDSD